MKIRLTKQFSFEMAHSLAGYDGPCRNIHGHSYKMDITIEGEPIQDPFSPKRGMVMDFSDLKRIVNENIISQFDHSLVLNSEVDSTLTCQLKEHYEKVVVVPYQPTTENFLMDFVSRIQPLLPKSVKLYSIRLHETDSSYAEAIL